jgi:hypothetical protein
MQGIYTYIPETNFVPREYSVAAFLYLQFVLHVMLYFYYYYYTIWMSLVTAHFSPVLLSNQQ